LVGPVDFSAVDPQWASVGDLVRWAARRFGDREYLRFPDGGLSFAAVDAYSDRLAAALAAAGVGSGDRVAVMLPNVTGWPLVWFAVLKAGAVTVPVDSRLREADLAYVLRDSGAVLVVTVPEFFGRVAAAGQPVAVHALAELLGVAAVPAPAAEPGPDGLANFQYTSGTTGFPKACMLSHDYWLRSAWLIARGAGLRGDDVVLMTQPFSYLDPQWAALLCLIGGNPYVVLPRFSASGYWAAVREHRATLSYTIGTMPLLLYKQPPEPADRDHRLRLMLCSAIPPDLHAAMEQRWGVPWREIYGSTESGLDLMVPVEETDCVGTGSIGRPPPGKQARVVDPDDRPVSDGKIGEIVVRGRPMMRGYWNHPEATQTVLRGGWYHTGDLGYRDERGRFHLVGRLKEMIRRGGENISAAQVEDVLGRHPAVLSVALVGIPDDLYGEVPKAFVQLKPGHAPDAGTAKDIVAYARGHLARFKLPAFVEFVDGFPLTPSARIQKRKLLEPVRDQRAGAFDVREARA
jgi:acyl-CoA synthetase (AMP-forming)/AMP-acid ligase II